MMSEARPGVSGITVGLHRVSISASIHPIVVKQQNFDENLELVVDLTLEAVRACFSEHK